MMNNMTNFIKRQTSASAFEETDEEPRRPSLQKSISDGASSFFSSVIAKKNGLINDLSSKLELNPKRDGSTASGQSSRASPATSVGSSPTRSEAKPQFPNGEIPVYVSGSKKDPDSQSLNNYLENGVELHVSNGGTKNGVADEKTSQTTTTPQRGVLKKEESMSKKTPPPRPPRPKLEKKESFSAEEVFMKETWVDETGHRRGKRRNSLLVNSDDEDESLLVPDVDTSPNPNQLLNEFKFESEKSNVSADAQDLMDFTSFSNNLDRMSSADSSEVEFGGDPIPRSGSQGSDVSWMSSFSSDSQLDEPTRQVMEFMKGFVEKIFNGSEISQMDKAMFGEYCQGNSGRLYFARSINAQRVHTKTVEEQIFYRLIQFFAIALFECNESEDFSPAKTLMNMCFTFCHEVPHPSGDVHRHYLYSYMKDQPIWKSVRFWNAAFFDAVQHERSRKPVCTSGNDTTDKKDDRTFQRNITFGQLGTFTCNMRALGLTKELCLAFLKKQATIANLKEEQVNMLKENIERWNDHAVVRK